MDKKNEIIIKRITKNEERLDKALLSVQKIEDTLILLKKNKKDLSLLKKYYGSKNWFKDKEAYEKGTIFKVKAGVLSEDIVWNMLHDMDELMEEMYLIINSYLKNK